MGVRYVLSLEYFQDEFILTNVPYSEIEYGESYFDTDSGAIMRKEHDKDVFVLDFNAFDPNESVNLIDLL